ncbi:DUF937 domain-containing protein [Ramlibacter sp. USB13]|uniref:DUF937 domain-containing protein n=1 Tax=Ramlibacter cellulosilyticus TaxID=2764187 RepID=A0A923S993_9BURK|nr:DUF937 domain-containing protein [Ramlibacter cellulosilyticus]MBC5781436.1 DUF937 domain-containing protein [Ramlibacter cellulosilyticus]
MNIGELLAQSGGLASIANELGISPQQASAGAEALAPAVLGGFQKRTQEAGGGGLSDLLSSLGGGGLLEQVLSPRPTDVSAGNDVLGEIFGSKDVSRAVAQDAAGRSGLDPELLKKMLPLLAMVVTGLMAKGQGSAGSAGGGLGGMLGSILGGGSAGGSGLGGLGGLGRMLDANGDGNPLDDILRAVGKSGR